MNTLRSKLARWVDECKLALAGVGLAARFWQFWVVAIVVFVCFATLLNMLAFPASFQYLWDLPDFGKKLAYLGEMFLGVFGYRKAGVADFLPILIISILQAIVVALIVLVWQRRKLARRAASELLAEESKPRSTTKRRAKNGSKNGQAEAEASAPTIAAAAASHDSGAQLSKAGIVTGLAVLAGGCPTCGTSLLAPVLGAIFSGSSAVVGDTISWVLTLLAIIIALFSFKKVGLDAYVIIVSERRRNREK